MRNPICYVGGDSFPSIFGGHTDCHYGSIGHLLELDRGTERRYPYLKNKFVYSTSMGFQGAYKTWKECKRAILNQHPNATFEIYWEEFYSSFPDAELMEVTNSWS